MPGSDSAMPTAAPSRPRTSEPWVRAASMNSAASTRVQYSHGPKPSAKRASDGDMPASNAQEIRPPTTEAKMPNASARSALPCWAIG